MRLWVVSVCRGGGVCGSHGSSSFVVLGRLHLVFCSSHMDVHSPHQYTNAPLRSRPHQYLLSFGITSGKSLSDTRNVPWRSLCQLNSLSRYRPVKIFWVLSQCAWFLCLCPCYRDPHSAVDSLSVLHGVCSFWKVSSHVHRPISAFPLFHTLKFHQPCWLYKRQTVALTFGCFSSLYFLLSAWISLFSLLLSLDLVCYSFCQFHKI